MSSTTQDAKAGTSEDEQNEYERQRDERIGRNRAVMAQLGLGTAAHELVRCFTKGRNRKPTCRKKLAVSNPTVSRRTTRSSLPVLAAAAPTEGSTNHAQHGAEAAELLTLEEYFKWKGVVVEGLVTDGQYRGWVCDEVAKQYGICGPDTEEPVRMEAPTKCATSQSGWSDARARSSKRLTSNPNAFFYRHVAPHEQQSLMVCVHSQRYRATTCGGHLAAGVRAQLRQAMGEWTQEEHELFMRTAREHGVGDRWGLFASHIPRRVGYQCSAYYRDCTVARGLILDPRFRMTRSGTAVFVG